jgi:methylated-DNA-protein-cysteine methyltransferase-like protein
MSDKGVFVRVYKTVSMIPSGKVATYGSIAKIVGINDARKVGWALHANKDIKVPCHRVVNRNGKLADNFAFDGSKEQRKRLVDESVGFIDEKHVDLKKYIWEPQQ